MGADHVVQYFETVIKILVISCSFIGSVSRNHGIVKICAVKKYPKFDFTTYRASIAVTTINSFLEFCQGRRRRLF